MKQLILLFLVLTQFYPVLSQTQVESAFNDGVNYLKTKKYEKAVKEFSKVLEKAEQTELKKYCYIYRAFSYNGLREFDNAIADLDKAIELDPSDLATYVDRGKAKIYNKSYIEARKDFLHVVAIDSFGEQGQPALYYLGQIAYNIGEYEESISWYDKLIELSPNDPELYFNRGAAKDMIMDSEGAIRDYDKAIELYPDYTAAYANRGVAKINLIRKHGNVQPTKVQTADACKDLKKAKSLGDTTIEDMIYIHCK